MVLQEKKLRHGLLNIHQKKEEKKPFCHIALNENKKVKRKLNEIWAKDGGKNQWRLKITDFTDKTPQNVYQIVTTENRLIFIRKIFLCSINPCEGMIQKML